MVSFCLRQKCLISDRKQLVDYFRLIFRAFLYSNIKLVFSVQDLSLVYNYAKRRVVKKLYKLEESYDNRQVIFLAHES